MCPGYTKRVHRVSLVTPSQFFLLHLKHSRHEASRSEPREEDTRTIYSAESETRNEQAKSRSESGIRFPDPPKISSPFGSEVSYPPCQCSKDTMHVSMAWEVEMDPLLFGMMMLGCGLALVAAAAGSGRR